MANTTETATFNVKSNVGEVGKDAASAAGEFKVMGVSLNSVKAGLVSVGKTAKASFATIRAGIISTGIGALLIAVTSLISYFTNTKRGADKLAQAFTAMGAVVDVLTDRLSKVGEAISFVFSGEFRKAGEALKGTFTGITDEVEKEVKAMVALKKRTQELRDADIEFMVQKAKTRQEIEKARLNAEDETKSAKERLTALKTALDLEEKTTQRELELARERLAIQQEEMALSENSAEDEARLAQLKVELIEKETASVKMRRRVVTEVNALDREIAAEENARAKEKQDRIDAENKRIADEKKKADDAKAAADKLAADNEIKEAQRVADAKQLIADKLEESKQKTLQMGADAAIKIAGEGSAVGKAVAVSMAIMNTKEAITAALGMKPYGPWNIAQAIATGIFGMTQVQDIINTQIPGGGGGGGSAGSIGATPQAPAPQMMSGAFELSGGQAPEAMRAYVVTDEMTNSQNQLANIRRRATI